jgi:hypothetical protein
MEAAFAAWNTALDAPDLVVQRKPTAFRPFDGIAIADEIGCNYVVRRRQPLAEYVP